MDSFTHAIRLYEQKEDNETVFDVASEALEVDSGHRKVLQAYIECATQLERLNVAEEYLREQVEATGDDYPYYLFLAQIAERRGDIEGAGRMYSNLQNEGHQDSLIVDGLARTGWVDDDVESMILDPQFELDGPLDLSSLPGGSATPQDDGLVDASGGQSEPLLGSVPGSEAEAGEDGSSGLFVLDQEDEAGIFRVNLDEEPFESEEGEPAVEASLEAESAEATGSLEECLEEADFYLKLGYKDDAVRLLEKLLAEFPDEERVVTRARTAGLDVGDVSDEVAVSSDGKGRLDDFDSEMESALDSLFIEGSGKPAEAEEVLRYDVTGSADQDGQNPEVHYDLGLAYKEMGLVDDAIQEFLKANELAEDQELAPQRILCCSMLTSSFNEVERSEDAVEWAYKGLDLPDIKDFEWKALKYDLASALEKQQEFDRALEEYEEILVRDSQYRDVDQRVEILRTQAV